MPNPKVPKQSAPMDSCVPLVRDEGSGGLGCATEAPPSPTNRAIDALAAISHDLQAWWEEEHGRPAEHASAIRATNSGSLLCEDGDEIKPREQIRLHFAGGPMGMPEPWALVKAENYFSSVNYRLNPRVTVRAANGVEETFDNANFYSPCRPTDLI